MIALLPPRLRRGLRSAGRAILPLLVTLVLAVGVMSPYLSDRMYQNGDLWNFLGGVVEARNAIAEGQFPIRVAPRALDGERYPLFQFYANLPFTVAAIILGEDGRNPYAAWKWTMFAALMIGGLSLYRLCHRWTRSRPAALSAVAVFFSAPYLLTNLNDRGAVAEAIAICLLPVAMLSTWTCMVRPGVWRAAVCAIAWTAIGLTHNITYLYGATFVGLFIVSFVRPRGRFVRRIGRLGLAAGLHLGMLAWYVVPQFHLMPELAIAGSTDTPNRSLTPLGVLLWPVCKTPDASTMPRLGLQVGWLVIAGAVAGMLLPWSLKRPKHDPRDGTNDARPGRFSEQGILSRAISLRLGAIWTLALLAAWSPFDFWSAVPRLFHFVQFTYRLLGFVIIFGAMLTAFGVAALLKRRVRSATANEEQPKRHRGTEGDSTVDDSIRSSPEAGEVRRREGGLGRGALRASVPVWLLLVLVAAALTQFAYFPPAQYHPRGAHRWINDRPDIGGQGDYLLRPREPAALPEGMRLVNADVFIASRKPDSLPVFRAEPRRPSRLVLPVLWYPDMLDVTVNGKPSRYGVSGRYVTVDVPAGRHSIAVRFVGLPWANQCSAVATFVTLGLIAWKVGRRVNRRKASGFAFRRWADLRSSG